MPGTIDLLISAYMSFVLLSCIMSNEIIKVKTMCCYLQKPREQWIVLTDRSVVRIAQVGC